MNKNLLNKNFSRLFLGCIIFTMPLCFISAQDVGEGGGAETQPVKEGEVREVSGVVRLVGNEPFPELIITDSTGRDWFIVKDEEKKLRTLEHKEVKLTASVHLKELTLANGKKLGIRLFLYNLKNIKVLKNEN